jgi:hypothetical protein
MKRAWMTFLVIGLAVAAMTCGTVLAQATAQISGAVKDQSGAVLPGVEITVTQTDTQIARMTVSNETGAYALPNLPIGSYRLEASLPGFRKFVQTGIVLEVNGNPTLNVVMEVGQVSEQVEVQANASLVETRQVGVGEVMENARILDLPLNGRNVADLVALSGTATPSPILNGNGGRDPFSAGNFSIAGGLNSGLNYTLDGASHINAFDNSYLTMPFPDALQEFKVETSATGAQTNGKSAGSISLVTKSGTNDFHGDVFEFVRNGKFNARNAFSPTRDTIKRNQFGGTIGGPIIANKLFFFGGYQGTLFRQDPADQIAFVPTAAELAGDFSALASPACNGGRAIALKAPFVNNRVDPKLFSAPALALTSKLPQSTDPCGRVTFGDPVPQNDHVGIGRIDFQQSAKNTIFGRYLVDHNSVPPGFEINHSPLISGTPALGKVGLAQAFTIGDTYLISSNVVNAFRLLANRAATSKPAPDFSKAGLGPTDIGIRAFTYQPYHPNYTITGGFSTGYAGAGPTHAATFGASDDLSVLHGNHQWAFGGQMNIWYVNTYQDPYAAPQMSFNGQTTGLGLGDFLLGNASSFAMGTFSEQFDRGQYLAIYAADTWKVKPRLTVNYGLRWEPYLPDVHLDRSSVHFDMNAFNAGIRSNQFKNTPPGLFYDGDPSFPSGRGIHHKLSNFSPRLGFAWDVGGDGRTSVRVSAGRFFDYPSPFWWQGLDLNAPFTQRIARTNVNFQNPWANEPGGDPFPLPYGHTVTANAPWPPYLTTLAPDTYDLPNLHVDQWNLSIQRQVRSNWLVSATYLGNTTTHLPSTKNLNPAVFLGLGSCTLAGVTYPTCSTTANQNQRRRLSLGNPATAQYFSDLLIIDAGGKANYNGLLLAVQHRPARGVTVSANYTWAHCISDPGGDQVLRSANTVGYTNPDSRRFDRGNCITAGSDIRQFLNLTSVAEVPQFSNRSLRLVGSGWRISPILKIRSGDYLSVTTNVDRALNAIVQAGAPSPATPGIGQRVNQVLASPYGNKTAANYLNPAAFALPAMGTLGNMGRASVRGPGFWQFDLALSRTFQLREAQKVEFRAEAFNLTNSVRLNDPDTNLNSNTFGQIIPTAVSPAFDPRIMQFALKYFF